MFSDLEYVIIYFLLIVCIIGGSEKREHKIKAKSWSLLAIDKTASNVMKAIACIFVLIGHYGTCMVNSGVDIGMLGKISWYTTANVALCWFMFFSGYGLSVKDYTNIDIGIDWLNRVKKIYLPLLAVSISAIIICAVLPNLELERTWWGFNTNVQRIHCFNIENLGPLSMSALGLFDWYVSCILIFYSIFYFALYLSTLFRSNHTIILGLCMLLYNVIAYKIFGWEQAHYYRFPWIFMLGHIVAVYKRNPPVVNILIMCAFIPTILVHDKVMLVCFLLAVIGLLFFAAINRRYYIGGRPILYLGSISYFFYLCHGRIGYTLLAYTGIRSLLLWIAITIIVSAVLMEIYKRISQNI